MAQSTLARLRPKHWKTETWVCSMRGHIVPAARVRRLRPGTSDDRLGVDTPQGRFGRCLRCDLWLAVEVPGPGDPGVTDVLGDDAALPRPRRGIELDQSLVVRLIAIERAFHVLAYLTVAAVAVVLWADYGTVHRWATDLVHNLSPAGHPLLNSNLSRLSRLKVSTLEIAVERRAGLRRARSDRGRRPVARAALGRVPDRGGHGDLHPHRSARARPARHLAAHRRRS